MIKMLRTYKIELKPTKKQKYIFDDYIGVSRWAYNKFLDINFNNYKKSKGKVKYMSAYAFSKWFNNEYLKDNPNDIWIKDYYAKHVKQAFIDADINMRAFFKHKRGKPHFRSFRKHQGNYFFTKNGNKNTIHYMNNKIKLPKIGWVKFKEKDYLKKDKSRIIKQGRVKEYADRYYITILVEELDSDKSKLEGDAVGIDLGIKEFAILSNKTIYKNLNKTNKLRKLRKQLRRLQRKYARQHRAYKIRLNKNNMERRATTDFNLTVTNTKILKKYSQITNILNDYQNKIISTLVKDKPKYLAIEDLNVSDMMKNRHLSKAIQQEKFYRFRTRLIDKCKWLGIPVHLVNTMYPSSKTCHNCGNVIKDLKLSDRIYKCPKCGYIEDRDINASLNIRDTENFELAY